MGSYSELDCFACMSVWLTVCCKGEPCVERNVQVEPFTLGSLQRLLFPLHIFRVFKSGIIPE